MRATVDHAEVGPIDPNARAVVAVNADSELLPSLRLTPQALEPLPDVLQLELRKFTRQQLQKVDDAPLLQQPTSKLARTRLTAR